MISLIDAKKVVGLKQSKRALKEGTALKAYLAKDADGDIAGLFEEACAQSGVELLSAESMSALGDACGLDVGAAVAVLLK